MDDDEDERFIFYLGNAKKIATAASLCHKPQPTKPPPKNTGNSQFKQSNQPFLLTF